MGAIVIQECAYEVVGQTVNSREARLIRSLIGKDRDESTVFDDIAVLLADLRFESAQLHRNTLYVPSLRACLRVGRMTPGEMTDMLASDGCDRAFVFALEGESMYYELTLAVDKEAFTDFLRGVDREKGGALCGQWERARERNRIGSEVVLRTEGPGDRDAVERVTYLAFLDAEHADGDEALLARKLRLCSAFVPELDYVAELDGMVVGNIMYTQGRVVGGGSEWDTLTFGPVSVLPRYQRNGVGSALIRKTLGAARNLGWRAVLIFGHEGYYPRFGFRPASEYGITTADGRSFPAFMALPLYEGALDGVHGRFFCDDVYSTLDRGESDAFNASLAESVNGTCLVRDRAVEDGLRDSTAG